MPAPPAKLQQVAAKPVNDNDDFLYMFPRYPVGRLKESGASTSQERHPQGAPLAGWARGENASVLVGAGTHDLLMHPYGTYSMALRLIREAFTRTGSHGVISILEHPTLQDAQAQMNRLPFVAPGIMTFDYAELTEL